MEQEPKQQLVTKPRPTPPRSPGRPKSTDVELAKQVKQFAVILPDKTRVMVPVDEANSREKGKILVARLHAYVEKQLDKMDGVTQTPKEISDMVQAVARLVDLERAQGLAGEGGALPTDMPGGGGASGAAMSRMLKAAAEGAAAGTADGFMAKLAAMDKAAKQAEKKVEPVEITAKEVKQ